MSYKNVIGYCLVGAWFIWVIADTFMDTFAQYGWHALWITPVLLLFLVALLAFVLWLLD